MALSMDEQRMLAEIERRLAAEEPALAARLSSFKRPGLATFLRSPRVRIVGSVFTVAVVAVASLVVYAMIPLRAAHTTRTAFTTRPQASPVRPVITGPRATGGTGTRGTAASPVSSTHVRSASAKTSNSQVPGK
jgi:hypothetical protein